ncbi:uncharacterized protein EI90DRAFT_3020611 [Cantharellus anzutake]|uniref:uncharacterized protein n=1 Tax=Cantharellus anzutake TaxID=1750568 RepID=UPI001904C2FC|nr:uncharacterized protein EI90DRAFT_3020611 [Cantharellus anzutake]KAF8319903.1 hypothetical protein EI90DRAFT_3020611 [Cantharellus anzutake]
MDIRTNTWYAGGSFGMGDGSMLVTIQVLMMMACLLVVRPSSELMEALHGDVPDFGWGTELRLEWLDMGQDTKAILDGVQGEHGVGWGVEQGENGDNIGCKDGRMQGKGQARWEFGNSRQTEYAQVGDHEYATQTVEELEGSGGLESMREAAQWDDSAKSRGEGRVNGMRVVRYKRNWLTKEQTLAAELRQHKCRSKTPQGVCTGEVNSLGCTAQQKVEGNFNADGLSEAHIPDGANAKAALREWGEGKMHVERHVKTLKHEDQ